VVWSEGTRQLPITAAVVTHFHEDRVGGVPGLAGRGIPVWATAYTIELATARGEPVPTHTLVENALPEVVWYYPGPAHTADNIVVWHEASRTLFAGCMIKALEATDLGNVADADVRNWDWAITGTIDRFGPPSIVVPGHGAPGDGQLLEHTRVLAGPQECTSAADCVVTIDALDGCACCYCVPPRAMSLRAIEVARENMLSCEPICPGECPPCTPESELSRLGAECSQGRCVMVSVP
jgi:glyoxylase-like metal-dependent hydrolase (beta-lactamase superfamily II)